MNGNSAETYEVGYGKPPAATRFQKEGQAIRADVRRSPLNQPTSVLSSRRSTTKKSSCVKMASANR